MQRYGCPVDGRDRFGAVVIVGVDVGEFHVRSGLRAAKPLSGRMDGTGGARVARTSGTCAGVVLVGYQDQRIENEHEVRGVPDQCAD